MKINNREKDEFRTNIINDFLDYNLYYKFNNVKRINDKENQIKGVDIIFDYNNENFICDEKAALNYANKNLQTFSFELSFINKRGLRQDGWLIDSKKINNSFLLIWINKSKKNFITELDDLQEIEIMLIRKIDILNFLFNCNINIEKIIEIDDEIRDKKIVNYGNLYTNGYKFVYSEKFIEEPINLLISRNKLREISIYNEIIKNETSNQKTNN